MDYRIEELNAFFVSGQEIELTEYKFAVYVRNNNIQISDEHKEYKWVNYDTAVELLKFDSNKIVLWELDNKIKMNLL